MFKRMKKKAIEAMFVISFTLTGCGIDSIVESKRAAITWVATAAVMIFCAKILGRFADDDK